MASSEWVRLGYGFCSVADRALRVTAIGTSPCTFLCDLPVPGESARWIVPPVDENVPHPDHLLGAAGEAAAARWLRRRGWQVLATGWRGGGGEIDIVAERRGVVAACEVKTRTTVDPHTLPVADTQRQRLVRAAQAWAARHPAYGDHALRPDLIIVTPRGVGWRITRIEDIGPGR